MKIQRIVAVGLLGLVLNAPLALAQDRVAQDDHAAHVAPAAPSGNDEHASHADPAMPASETGRSDHTADETDAVPASTIEDRASEREHVAPDPPLSSMPHMTYEEMVDLMQMDDRSLFGHAVLDQLEWRRARGNNIQAWDAYAWYGRDEGKLWLKTEGERSAAKTEYAEVELLFNRYIARWWSLQVGARHEFGEGPERSWLAVGLQGLAPYFFEVDATAYVGAQGRTALRLESEYELLLTQRLILQPALEVNFYGKDDEASGFGAGLADAELGIRLRYEFHRQFAPFVGVSYRKLFGKTQDLAAGTGDDASEAQFVAGFRIWF
jgi:copper resistance protein B